MYQSNIDFLKLAEKFSTPLYVYELNQIKHRYEQLFDTFNYPKLKIFFAMKANNNIQVLKYIKELGSNVDAVSPAEIHLAKLAGFESREILFTANSLTDAEMLEAQNEEVTFNLGSLSELKRYGKLFPSSKIFLRFNPDVIAGAHAKIQTGGQVSKFGILLDHLSECLEVCKKYNLKVIGIHKHTGSGIKDQKDYLQAVENLLEIVTPANFPELETVDFGGGLFIPYYPEEQEYDYQIFAKEILQKLAKASARYSKDLNLYFEPGKFLVSEAGSLVVQVNTLKDNNGYLIAGTNSGFNQLARPVLYDAYHHITNLSNPKGKKFTYDIVGNICETGDNFAKRRELPEIREEDLLLIHNAGAYGSSMGSNYNLRGMPDEICLLNNEIIHHRPGKTSKELASSQL